MIASLSSNPGSDESNVRTKALGDVLKRAVGYFVATHESPNDVLRAETFELRDVLLAHYNAEIEEADGSPQGRKSCAISSPSRVVNAVDNAGAVEVTQNGCRAAIKQFAAVYPNKVWLEGEEFAHPRSHLPTQESIPAAHMGDAEEFVWQQSLVRVGKRDLMAEPLQSIRPVLAGALGVAYVKDEHGAKSTALLHKMNKTIKEGAGCLSHPSPVLQASPPFPHRNGASLSLNGSSDLQIKGPCHEGRC
jgi:hypothetical protein